MIRLDKYLADMGIGTRSELKKMIRSGRVSIDGMPAKKPEEKVNPDTQEVSVDGKRVSYSSFEYFMLHKPAGVVSATKDPKEKTVLDLITGTRRKDLFPVGRLDKDTEGLLLITNDGDLAHRLLTPGKHVNKTYYAKIEGRVTEEDVTRFQEGLDIGDETLTMPACLEVIHTDAISEIKVTIQEGRYHQVKRMFEAVGKKVIYLKRLSMGSLALDETLEKGAFRHLTEEELDKLC